jgi:hypothetical protein
MAGNTSEERARRRRLESLVAAWPFFVRAGLEPAQIDDLKTHLDRIPLLHFEDVPRSIAECLRRLKRRPRFYSI